MGFILSVLKSDNTCGTAESMKVIHSLNSHQIIEMTGPYADIGMGGFLFPVDGP